MTPGGMLILLYINSAINIFILLYIIFRKREKGDIINTKKNPIKKNRKRNVVDLRKRKIINSIPPEIPVTKGDSNK